jgi:hypothetical protein
MDHTAEERVGLSSEEQLAAIKAQMNVKPGAVTFIEDPMAEHRRAIALQAAVAAYGDDVRAADTRSIIDVARDFEIYLKGD